MKKVIIPSLLLIASVALAAASLRMSNSSKLALDGGSTLKLSVISAQGAETVLYSDLVPAGFKATGFASYNAELKAQ